jgi:hypothetical protein
MQEWVGFILVVWFESSRRKGSMMKHLIIGIVVPLIAIVALPVEIPSADQDSGSASISDFKTQSLYRAVRLDWTVKTPFNKQVGFQLLRSDSFVEGPYEEIAKLAYDKEKVRYTYYDKSIGTESKYYYKLVVIGVGETYGPKAARPYFSPPTT